MARDLTCSGVLLIIAAGYYSLASRIGRSALADEVGPNGLPILYATALTILALGLATQALLRPLLLRSRCDSSAGERIPPSVVLRRACGVLAIGIGYLLIVTLVGYLFALMMVIAAMAMYHGEHAAKRLGLIAVAGAGFFWLIFVWLLGIPMPAPWST